MSRAKFEWTDTLSHVAEDPRMGAIETGLIEYLDDLQGSLWGVDGEPVETLSGLIYCGCEDCQSREILMYVLQQVEPLIIEAHYHVGGV